MSRRRVAVTALVGWLLVLGACSSEGSGQAEKKAVSCTIAPKLVSRCGVWWGAYVAPDPAGDDSTADGVLKLERQTGRRLAIVHRYHDMSTTGRGLFPDAAERALGADRLLFIAWASRVYSGVDHSWREIADGKIDATVIDPAARRIAAYGRQLFIDFDHEPETPRPNEGPDTDFAAAYRHIHERFQALGATNAVWVWTVTGFKTHWDRYDAFYPGDDVVDWVAWDPYDYAECRQTPRQSFADAIKPFYEWLVDHHRSKPFMLAEYGTVANMADPSGSVRWYRGMIEALRDHPRIRAVVQFDHRPTEPLPICDTRLQPKAVLDAWAAAGHDQYVNPPLPL